MSAVTPVRTATPARYCTMAEAAATLALSRDTIRRMIRSGELEARKFGKSVRITAESIATAGKPMAVAGAR